MAGLDSIKKFADGGDPGEETTSQGAIQTTAPKSTGITGKIALDPTQTEAILTNMQQYIDERNSPMNALMGGINKARAGLAGPSALTAYQREQDLQDKQIMDYRTQMAAYRAAQKQAENDAQRYAAVTPGAGAGAGPVTKGFTDPQSGIFIPPEQSQREFLAGPAGQGAVRQEFLKTATSEKLKRENNVALDALVPYPINGREELITLRDATELAKKNPNLPRNQEILVQANKTENAPTTTGIPTFKDPSIKIVSAQRTPEKGKDLYETSVKNGTPGIQPNGLPVAKPGTSPHETKPPGDVLDLDSKKLTQTGRLELAQKGYYQPYGIDSPHWEKIATKSTAIAPATTQPTLAEIQAQRKIAEEESTSAARKRGESTEADRTEFIKDIKPANIIEEKTINKRIQSLVKDDPQITGVLAGEGYGNAVAGQLERGIGNIKLNEFSTAILQTLPGVDKLTMAKRNELGTYLARMELKAAKLIKGQGQITEGERAILERASSSLKDPAEAIYKKAKMLERIADLNAELGQIYGNGSKYPNFSDFSLSNDPKVLEIHARYQKDLENILNENVVFNQRAPGATASKTQHPKDIQDILNKNKVK